MVSEARVAGGKINSSESTNALVEASERVYSLLPETILCVLEDTFVYAAPMRFQCWPAILILSIDFPVRD